MNAATAPRAEPLATRLLCVGARAERLTHGRLRDLPRLLRAGDLLVLNDAATLPGSLPARGPRGEPLELRLTGPGADRRFSAVLFGEGDWRRRTEDRPPPAPVREGDVLTLGPDLRARVAQVLPQSPRLLEIVFDREGAALWGALYRHGRPVQYSYLERPLDLWDVQTAYAGRPWAAETPSAGRPLTWALLSELRAAGVRTAFVTHAAGLSSTGDPALDARLPFPERYEVTAEAAAAVRRARALGGRVVAVGTTVVRALETSVAADGLPRAADGVTELVVGPEHELRAVDAILTGVHEPGSSHFALLSAFLPAATLAAALRCAEDAGYLAHEFGDAMLVWRAVAEAGDTRPIDSRA
jgi:S-adenosylmethionine:tRNA ribosyltransferase-isomerase